MSTMGLAVRVTRVTRAAEASRSLWWDVSKEPCCTSPYCWCLRTYVRKEDEIASKFRNGNKVRQRRASTEARKFGVADGNSRRERCRSDVASSVRPSSPPLAIKRMRYSANPFCGSHTSGLEAPRLICGKSRSTADTRRARAPGFSSQATPYDGFRRAGHSLPRFSARKYIRHRIAAANAVTPA